MKHVKTFFVTFAIAGSTVLFFCCSNKDNRVTVLDTFDNGQPKTAIYKTIDDKNTYYEIKYDSLGRIWEITPYSDGQLNGTMVYFRENLDVGALLPHKDGKREGFVYEFNERLQPLFKGEAKNGKFNGLSTWFYRDGNLDETGIRTNDQNEGEWVEYHENGQMRAKGTYINGCKQSDWIYWNNDGTIDSTQHN